MSRKKRNVPATLGGEVKQELAQAKATPLAQLLERVSRGQQLDPAKYYRFPKW